MCGLYSARILELMEQERGKPVSECFDMICGTSIGGILAIGLSLGIEASTMRKELEKMGKEVFCAGEPVRKNLRRVSGIVKPIYNHDSIKPQLATLLHDPKTRKSKTLMDCQVPLLVPAVCVSDGQVEVFKSPFHPSYVKSEGYPSLVDIAMATSAAPIFFRNYRFGGKTYLDGGVVVNNPASIALIEATARLGQRIEDIFMIGLGTTYSPYKFRGSAKTNWGISEYFYKFRSKFSDLLHFQQNLVEQSVETALGERYIPIDSAQASGLGLDNASDDAIKTLKGLAEQSDAITKMNGGHFRRIVVRPTPDRRFNLV